MINVAIWKELSKELAAANVTLVAVSKTKPVEDIQALYDLGQRDFGENYVQELVDKQSQLPPDIRWHYIGHLQTNKVKLVVPFVHLIHAVDSVKLLQEINKQAVKNNVVTDVLLQMHIATEETKFGFSGKELNEALTWYATEKQNLSHVRIRGLMGMASFTQDEAKVRQEFQDLSGHFRHLRQTLFSGETSFDTCSIGMSGDYKIAVAEGSTMVRIGSMIFGARSYQE